MRKFFLACLIVLAQRSPLWAQSAVVSQQFAQGAGNGNNALLIATLPASGGGTFDHMHMVATFNCNWIAACDTTIDVTMGNRGGFSAGYTAIGNNPTGSDVAIVAYQQSDGSTNVYITMADGFDVATWDVLESVQETIYSPYQSITNIDQTPLPGTLVFNTSMAAYPPANWTGPSGSFVSVGNVGIGAAGLPLTSLQVNGTLYSTIIGNSPGFASWPNNNASYNFMGAGGTWGIRTDSSYGINFDVYSNAYPRTPFYISQNGNVGIGTISPAAQLEVNGNEKVDGSIIFPDGTSMSTAAANQNIAVSNGNMGIGTTNPQAALQVASAASPLASTLQPFGNGNVVIQALGPRSETAGAALTFAMDAGTTGTNLWEEGRVIATADTTLNNDASGRLSLQTRYIDRNTNLWQWNNNLVLTSNGSVGIGTTTPAAMLEVNGNAKIDGKIIFTDGTTLSTAASLGNSLGTVTTGVWNATPLTSPYLPPDVVYSDLAQTIGGQKSFTSNVGIGTTTPSTPLSIGTSATNPRSGQLLLSAPNGTQSMMENTAAGTDGKLWDELLVGHTLYRRVVNDFNNNATPYLVVSRSGIGVSSVSFPNGNVGIGTTSPGALFEVNGNVKLTSGSGASITFPDGSVQSVAWNGMLSGGDYAESVDVIGDRSNYEAGDLIVIASSGSGKFDKSNKPYSKLIAGVYSMKPGLVGRRTTAERPDKEDEVPMAMIGIVPTKVSTENGPIEKGDLLVSSSTPGFAMKGTDTSRMMGSVIGKALAPLMSGSGIIEVLISLQ